MFVYATPIKISQRLGLMIKVYKALQLHVSRCFISLARAEHKHQKTFGGFARVNEIFVRFSHSFVGAKTEWKSEAKSQVQFAIISLESLFNVRVFGFSTPSGDKRKIALIPSLLPGSMRIHDPSHASPSIPRGMTV
jgi:hypothetical protein